MSHLLILNFSFFTVYAGVPKTINLNSIGYSYYMDMQVNLSINSYSLQGFNKNSILIDTGSSFFVLKQPTNESEFNELKSSNQLQQAECLYLILDNSLANFTGTTKFPDTCYGSKSNNYSEIFLTSVKSEVLKSKLPFKLTNTFKAGFYNFILFLSLLYISFLLNIK